MPSYNAAGIAPTTRGHHPNKYEISREGNCPSAQSGRSVFSIARERLLVGCNCLYHCRSILRFALSSKALQYSRHFSSFSTRPSVPIQQPYQSHVPHYECFVAHGGLKRASRGSREGQSHRVRTVGEGAVLSCHSPVNSTILSCLPVFLQLFCLPWAFLLLWLAGVPECDGTCHRRHQGCSFVPMHPCCVLFC